MSVEAAPVIRKQVTVGLAPDAAFELFTTGMDGWWPADYRIGDRETKVVMEPHQGGRWYERAADGTAWDWGRVLVWEPPRRAVLSWQIGADWQHDPELVTEVEVRLTPEGDGTRVDLEHRHLERFGDATAQMSSIFDSERGWSGLLARYGAAAG